MRESMSLKYEPASVTTTPRFVATLPTNAGERGGNNLDSFEDFRTGIGSSQGQNLASAALFAPSSLDRGTGPSRLRTGRRAA